MENNTITNTNNIQKPVSLIVDEAKTTLINTINSIQLHPTILEMIMKELYIEVQNQALAKAKKEQAEYEYMLKTSVKEEPTIVDVVDEEPINEECE